MPNRYIGTVNFYIISIIKLFVSKDDTRSEEHKANKPSQKKGMKKNQLTRVILFCRVDETYSQIESCVSKTT